MPHPVIVTPPAATPVSLVEAKAHLRVDHADEDTLITSLIAAATAHLDGWTGILGRCLVSQTWRMAFDAFPGEKIRIPLGPVISVDSVAYTDTSGDSQTVASSGYEVDLYPLEAIIKAGDAGWPDTDDVVNAVRIQWTAGYADAAAVPDAIKSAMLMLIGHWYEHREAVVVGTTTVELPLAVASLLRPYRRVGV